MNNEETGSHHEGGARLPMWLGVLSLLLLALLAGLAVVFALGQDDASYPADSPEAAFGTYARAWDEGDTEAAYAALSDRARATVPERSFNSENRWSDESISRIWVDGRTGTDERTVLALTIETSYSDGLLGSDRYRDDARVVLVREDGSWKIDTPLVGYFAW
jgi:hypothetical protein